jgi:predicted dinucleotide-binding enzyme
MHIGVIGAGQLGATLAGWCAESGHEVAITSRHPERLVDLADRFGGHVAAMGVPETAEFADVVVFSPTWESAHDAIDAAAAHLVGKVVIDTTNPTGPWPPKMWPEERHSGLETLMDWAPEAHWVKAFNTLPTGILERRRGHDPLLAEFVSTEFRDARVAASQIIRDLGFAPFYAGGAETAWLTEPGGPLQMTEIDVVHATDALAEAMTVAR